MKNRHYLLKWVVVSTLIGIVAGSGAVAFYTTTRLATSFFLGVVVGYLPPNPAGEGATRLVSLWGGNRPWLLPLITSLGGLLSGIIVFHIAPEAEKGGQDSAIAAFHQNKAIRGRASFVKLIASAIIIGTGGSAGREGPIAYIGAGIGSVMSRLFHLNRRDSRFALVAGMAAGIGAIFRSPLGGTTLSMEILYQNGLAGEALIPALLASTAGYCVFGFWCGWNPIFAIPGDLTFNSPPQLFYYVLLGILCGLLGRLYAYGFQGIQLLFRCLSFPNWIKPALGGLPVGLIALAMPQVLGTGYGWIQISMGPGLLAIPPGMILLFPFAKILTTGLSIESGGSGGIFGPGIVIGGMGGALFWRLGYHLFPGLPPLPAPFVIIGMMALLGGIGHVPIAAMLMVAEMTGNLSLLAPAMLAVSVSCLLVGKQTLYRSQLETLLPGEPDIRDKASEVAERRGSASNPLT